MLSVVAGCVLLLIAVFADSVYFQNIVKPDIQVVLGTLIVGVVLFDKPLAGLAMGLAVMIMYLRVYARSYGITLNLFGNNTRGLSNKYPMKSLLKDYITPMNLKDAQDNVVNNDNLTQEIKGVKGVYGEAVYGTQGQDKIMPGLSDEAASVYAKW